MRDPSLTVRGERQSQALRTTFPYHGSVDLLVSSPIRRALYTTLLGFQAETDRGLKIIALPDLQETSDSPCNIGVDRDELEKEFGQDGRVDLSLVTSDWNVKVCVHPMIPLGRSRLVGLADRCGRRAETRPQGTRSTPVLARPGNGSRLDRSARSSSSAMAG